MMNALPKPFTVLVLRPDDEWDGPQANWVLREHVMANEPSEAGEAAIDQCIRQYYSGEDWEDISHDDFAIIAIYPGHLDDLYDPTA